MRIPLIRVAFAALIAAFSWSAQAQESELVMLRAEVEQLRVAYEARIANLERRLAIAEQNARQASVVASQVPDSAPNAQGSRPSAFNPAIGVILQGQAWHYSGGPDEDPVQGFPYGGEAGPVSEGLASGETELVFSANVDDKFTARLTTALAIEEGESVAEVEEAWVEAMALPAGLGAKFGRFYSAIGYLNERHAHTWDFVDQPLPYQAFLADNYLDDGVQLRWLAPSDLYMEFGAEVLAGSRYPASGNDNSGYGSYSLFANVGGDLGTDSSWLAGVSYLDADAVDRPSGDEDDPVLFTGDSSLATAHFVWKWAPDGNWRQRNFILQSEFLWRNEDGEYTVPGSLSADYDVDQAGWYLQAVYQPIPRWRFGARIDGLSGDDPGALFAGTPLAEGEDDPRRYSVMLDWSNSEFSRLRLQLARDESRAENSTQWGIQYIHSIGAHGAHTF